MKKQGRPSWISVIGIFNKFKHMAGIDVLNKLKHNNNNTKLKYGFFKVKFSSYP